MNIESSCAGLARASTPSFDGDQEQKDVDGRNKCGHDGFPCFVRRARPNATKVGRIYRTLLQPKNFSISYGGFVVIATASVSDAGSNPDGGFAPQFASSASPLRNDDNSAFSMFFRG